MNLFGIEFGGLNNLKYIPLLLAACVLVVVRTRRLYHATGKLAAPAQAKKILFNFSRSRQLFKSFLWVVGFIFLFIALLQPRQKMQEQTIAQEGRDLFIALDISRSMLAADIKPNRLQAAKKKIRTLLKSLTCERVGLILFSGSTFVQCPLTNDYGAFYMFLDQIDVETISSGTTAIDQAIVRALQSFKSAPERKNKLLVLFTDGEDFSSNLAQVKTEAAQEGMHIFTIGVGTVDGAPIPLFDGKGVQVGHQKDAKGAIVISKLNEGILQNLADDSGGVYIKTTHDDADIKRLVKQVQKFEKEKFDDKKVALYEQKYNYCAAVSFACFALEWIL